MHRPADHTIVALFVRVPVVGRVKTRLAAGLGARAACTLYRAMVADILRTLRACAHPLYLFHDGTEQSGLPRAWVAAAARVVAQQGEGIGERMGAAFAHCFGEKEVHRVVLVGSDIPGLDGGRVREATAALASFDVAITPVVDGGYCLIGLRRKSYQPRIFEEIPWSTGQVLGITLQRLAQCRLSVALQSPLQDIDTMRDLKQYRRQPCARALAVNRVISRMGRECFGEDHLR